MDCSCPGVLPLAQQLKAHQGAVTESDVLGLVSCAELDGHSPSPASVLKCLLSHGIISFCTSSCCLLVTSALEESHQQDGHLLLRM